MAGALGRMFIAKAVGYILQWTGSYLILFTIAGPAYVIALSLTQLFAPRLEGANVEKLAV
jgi:ACS family hexuronate transporter-like MFS transporter